MVAYHLHLLFSHDIMAFHLNVKINQHCVRVLDYIINKNAASITKKIENPNRNTNLNAKSKSNAEVNTYTNANVITNTNACGKLNAYKNPNAYTNASDCKFIYKCK